MTSNRTNLVKIENLPACYSDITELMSTFSPAGDIQDVTPVDPTTIIISFMRRSGAENAAFALHGIVMGGNVVNISLYYTNLDPKFFSDPSYQRLGQFIGNDQYYFNPASFQPWSGVASTGGQGPWPGVASSGGPVPRSGVANTGGPTQMSNPFASPTSNIFPGSSMLGNLANLLPAAGLGSMTYGVQSGGSGASHQSGGLQVNVGSNTDNQSVAHQTPSSSDSVLNQYTIQWTPPSDGSTDQCAICLCELGDLQSYNQTDPSIRCLSLAFCKHTFHQNCLEQLLAATPSTFLQCPTCKKVHGVKQGTMPTNGSIQHRITRQKLPGHEKFGCIEVTFMFQGGIQGPEHPNPGHPYSPVGFPRVAYLPDSPEGLEMLHGLYVAWSQRVLFTVGTSITTGRPNSVTWNDIHLKTYVSNSQHGYPDPQHLTNLAADLNNFGITQAEISRHMRQHPDLS